jgi:ABC-type thiamin/hydroxymethylpyrimidine transport system permease subunit
MSDSENREPATVPLLLLFIAFGALVLAFAFATVHHHTTDELTSYWLSKREHFEINWWLQHGYFGTAGLLVSPGLQNEPRLYRSATGGYLVSGFVVEKLCSTITGHPNWHLLALQNQLVSLLAAVLLALLGFRLARRFGLQPLHAFALGATLEAVYFTFPDNLMIFWEMTGRAPWLAAACVFLLFDERSLDRPSTRAATIGQAVAAFFLTYMEYIAGFAFIMSYSIAWFFLGERRSSIKRLVLITIVPMMLAIGTHRGQIALGKVLHPELPVTGRTFAFRSGLDGAVDYYGGHLDIAYRRDVARANFNPEKIRPLLFHWPWLFFASTGATIFIVIGAMAGRVPRPALVSLLSLLGAYLIYAAVFSQAVVIHPYYYDVMLFTPLMLSLFVLATSLIELITREKGVAVIVAIFLAIWVSMVQMRKYAVMYPPQPPPEATTGK